MPLNVERYINIFQSNSLLGGRDVMPMKGYHGHYASFDLTEHTEISHTNIEKAEAIHDQMVTKMQELDATPAQAEGDTVPIRFVVPADAALELWDSGTPMFARPGDTLQTLATLHQVPLWSLTELNPTAEGAQLAPGQRIIVPRHLLPRAASDTGAISGQAPAKRLIRGRNKARLALRISGAGGTGSASGRGGSKTRTCRHQAPPSESVLPSGPSATSRK